MNLAGFLDGSMALERARDECKVFSSNDSFRVFRKSSLVVSGKS
jgi:hypothetical protein